MLSWRASTGEGVCHLETMGVFRAHHKPGTRKSQQGAEMVREKKIEGEKKKMSNKIK